CNRYREREREHEILTEAKSSEANIEQFFAGQQGRRDMDTALLGRLVSEDVERALAQVPEDFRLAVILADLEDFSYKEIAEIMECPAGTVMSRLYRGRKILQKLLYSYALEQGIVKPTNPAAQLSQSADDLQAQVDDEVDPDGADADAPVDLARFRRQK